MATPIRGITIQLEGDATPLTQALRTVDRASQGTVNELSQINRALRFDPGNTTLLAQRFEVLQERVQQTSGRLETLRSAQEDVNRSFANGDIDASAYREFNRELASTESLLQNLRQAAEQTNLDINPNVDTSRLARAREELGRLGDAAQEAGREIGAGIAAGAAVGAAALAGIAAQGGDLAQRIAALDATADTIGFDNANGQLTDLAVEAAGFTGDLEGALEAVTNLANTDLTQDQLSSTLETLTGAALQFRETLSLEGIADGFQETLAIGEGAGSFIEFLERSGVNLDEFNEGLTLARTAGTDLDYVLGVLGGTNAQGVIDSFKEQNEALIASQEAAAQQEIAFSELSVALAPLTTALAEFVTGIVNFLTENEGLAIALAVLLGGITLVVGAFALLAPAVGAVIGIFGSAGAAAAALLNPIGLVVAAVIGIGAAIGLAFAIVPDIFNGIKDYFSNFGEDVKTVFSAIPDFIKNAFRSVVGFVRTPLNAVADAINGLIRGLNRIKLPDFLGGFGVNLPTIPKFARGTNYFRGGAAIVGEEGPELVNLPNGSSVVNARNTQRALSQDNQPLQISIPVMIDGRQVASATALYTNREIYNISENARRGGRTR